MQQTQSYCVCVSLPGSKRLIIPCMELIRFYFGSSSGLLHKLFTGPLAEKALWQHRNYDPVHGELYLKLADGISSFSAEDVGRIAKSREAFRAARMIFDSCMSANSQRLPVYPYTTFPFEGKTNLAATGKWLTHNGLANSTFVVYKLRSCSHPFPFRELRYEVSDNLRIRKPGNPADPSDPNARSDNAIMTKPSGTSLDSAEPGTSKQRRNLRQGRNMKFPDLVDKFVHRVKYETADRPEVMRLNQDGKKVTWATLIFSPEITRWVSKERWHPKQRGRLLNNGSFELKIPYSKDTELLMDILKYGAGVKVVDPPELISHISEEIRQMSMLYKSPLQIQS